MRSSPPRWTPGSRFETCRKPPPTLIPAPPCDTTAPAAVWTGTPPTSSPPTSPVPPGELTGQWQTRLARPVGQAEANSHRRVPLGNAATGHGLDSDQEPPYARLRDQVRADREPDRSGRSGQVVGFRYWSACRGGEHEPGGDPDEVCEPRCASLTRSGPGPRPGRRLTLVAKDQRGES